MTSSASYILGRLILETGLVVIVCTAIFWIGLKAGLPELDVDEAQILKIPRSLTDLQALHVVMAAVNQRAPFRVLACWIWTYLYLQALSLPGSLYLSLLLGALYPLYLSLPIVCLTVATGATCCFLLSAFLGRHIQDNVEGLLELSEDELDTATPRFKYFDAVYKHAYRLYSRSWDQISAYYLSQLQERVKSTRIAIEPHLMRGDMFSYLTILRMAPLPPHWIVNIICPHIGIPVSLFWITCALGVAGSSAIHVSLGSRLEQFSRGEVSWSWGNVLAIVAMALGVMLPVLIRKFQTRNA